ncbi:MAG TPA: site-2 protease family protein [Acidobacteriaceae bacterium]
MSTSSGLLDAVSVPNYMAEARPVPYWRSSPRRLAFQAGLALLTFFSATVIGMRYMYNFHQGLPPLVSDADIFPYKWILQNMSHFADGLPFSCTLIGILLCHEFGHFYFCQRNNVKATLPYLLPAPTLSGSAGAVIRLRSRIHSRKALLQIGMSGPICGILFALPCIVIGLWLSTPMGVTTPSELDHFRVNSPLLIMLLRQVTLLFKPDIPPLLHMVPHPILVASWIGVFITSLNLLPAGQLDGGHVIYSLSPKLHKITTTLTILLAIVAGTGFWIGWLLWAVLLMLPGMRHPTIKATGDEAEPAHVSMVVGCVVLFLLTIMLQPFNHTSLIDLIHKMH